MIQVGIMWYHTQRELHMLSYPLHPAGGIRGCVAQEGETGEGQRELPESQRGENSRLSIFLQVVICFIFLVSILAVVYLQCASNRSPVNLSMWAGL